MTNKVTGIKLHSYIKLKSAWANHEKLWISASSGKKNTIWKFSVLRVWKKYYELFKLLAFAKIILRTITQKAHIESRHPQETNNPYYV